MWDFLWVFQIQSYLCDFRRQNGCGWKQFSWGYLDSEIHIRSESLWVFQIQSYQCNFRRLNYLLRG